MNLCDLDEFSQKRYKEMPRFTDLQWRHHVLSQQLWAGMLLATYSRTDLDILRALGCLNGNDLAMLGGLDESFVDFLNRPIAPADGVCAHCGEALDRARDVITVPVAGREVAYHGRQGPCRKAAGWLMTKADRQRNKPPVPAAPVVDIGDAS